MIAFNTNNIIRFMINIFNGQKRTLNKTRNFILLKVPFILYRTNNILYHVLGRQLSSIL